MRERKEYIDCHDKYCTINYIMTNSEMPKFKIPLTLRALNTPQDQNFVTIGPNGVQYCIHWDGSLFLRKIITLSFT